MENQINQWLQQAADMPPQQWLYVLLALIAAIYLLVKIVGAIRGTTAADAIQSEAFPDEAYLRRVRDAGAEVLHRVHGKRHQLNHVLFHDSGIYVAVVADFDKPEAGSAVLSYDGKGIVFGDRQPFEQPIEKARAGGSWIRDLLKSETGRDFPVRTVLLCPGWTVHSKSNKDGARMWVLNPNALPKFLMGRPSQMKPEHRELAMAKLMPYTDNLETAVS